MSATFTDRPSRHAGFTVPELIAVMLLTATLSLVALPRLQTGLSLRDSGWRDQIVAVLGHARSEAIVRRRLVCATIETAGVTLTVAASNPATGCDAILPGPDNRAVFAAAGLGAASAAVSPPGALYFQPSGRVTVDRDGVKAVDRAILLEGQQTVLLIAETGHVD